MSAKQIDAVDADVFGAPAATRRCRGSAPPTDTNGKQWFPVEPLGAGALSVLRRGLTPGTLAGSTCCVTQSGFSYR